MENTNKFVNDAFHQLDLFLDCKIKPKGGRRFYCTSLSNLVHWGLIYGIKDVKFKSHFKNKQLKVFVTYKDNTRWHSRYCSYYSFASVWYLSLILQKIRDNDYCELTKYIDLMRKKLKRGKFV